MRVTDGGCGWTVIDDRPIFGNMFQTPTAAGRDRCGFDGIRAVTIRRAFSLIEIMIVVIILGILAVIAVPQFTGASETTKDSSGHRVLQVVRYQISYYESQTKELPRLLESQWDDLLHNDYIHSVPVNPFNEWTLIAAAPGPGVGWVWRDTGHGSMQIYLTDSTGTAEWPE